MQINVGVLQRESWEDGRNWKSPEYHITCLLTSETLEIPRVDMRMQLLVISGRVVALVALRFDP